MSEHNPVFADVLATAREVWRKLPPGGMGRVSCCLGLLERQDPREWTGAPAAERVAAWAAGLGFGVEKTQETIDPRKKSLIVPPVILVISFSKPAK